jgi:hypothetical protein
MRKIIFYFCLLSILLSKAYAQDSTQLKSLQDSINSLKVQVNSVQKSIDTAKGEGSFVYYDSTSYAFAKSHPAEVLYKNCIYLNTAKTQKNEHPKWDAYVRFWLCLLLTFSILFFSIKWAQTTTIIRDEAYDTSGVLVTKNLPYSYSRTQLLWWTTIIMSCYVLLFGITGVLIPLNGTVVLLLGLGVGVYGFARLIDNNQTTSLESGTRHQETEGHKDFLTDILSDNIGISIHRVQSFVFNIIFGLAFIFYYVQALRTGDYPFLEMEQWQFALLGISSSAYLGIKAVAENRKGK